jgi:hypothetical protein
MDSVFQIDKECWVCGHTYPIETHHIFGAANRKNSEKYGLKVYLCKAHHTGDNGVHFNKRLDLELKRMAQGYFEEEYGHDEFMRVFGRNYL